MSYCTLEEAWGSDFKKKHKKSKKEKRFEQEERKSLESAVDPQLLVPPPQPRLADNRKIESPVMLQGYDSSYDRYMSPYKRYTQDPVKTTNQTVLATSSRPTFENPLTNESREPINNVITISKDEYERLTKPGNPVIEGFANSSDDEFNKLLLYIFTGIFYLFTMDLMYQLGKKSFS